MEFQHTEVFVTYSCGFWRRKLMTVHISCICLFCPQSKHATEYRSPLFIFSLSSALTQAVVRGKL